MAQTVLAGNGNVDLLYALYDESVKETHYRLQGDFDFKDGTITIIGTDVQLLGSGSIGKIVVSSDEEIEGKLSLMDSEQRIYSKLKVDSLEIGSGTVIVEGNPDGVNSGSWLKVTSLKSSQEYPGHGKANVTGNGVLVIGSRVSELDDKTITTIIGETQAALGETKATLLTDSTQLNIDIEEGSSLTIDIGSTVSDEKESGIYIGKNGQWIVYYPDLTEPNGISLTGVTAENGATLVVYGWDGSEFSVPVGWKDKSFSFVDSLRLAKIEGNLFVPMSINELPKSRVKPILKQYESAVLGQSLMAAKPGYRFLKDALNLFYIGGNAFTTVLDSAVSLPLSSGILTSSERAFGSMLDSVQNHRVKLGEETHWWAQIYASDRTMNRMFPTELGYAKTDTKIAGGVLGVDRAFGENWVASLAVSGATVDADTKQETYSTTGKGTLAGFSAEFVRPMPESELRFGLHYGRIETEAKLLQLNHYLTTEPTVEFFNAGLGYTRHFDGRFRISPEFGVDVNWARVKKGEITDAHSHTGIYGIGFETETKDRIWGSVKAGLSISTRTTFDDMMFSPELHATVRANVGDRRWKMRSRLPGSALEGRYSATSTAPLAGRIDARFLLASSGEKNEMAGGFLGFGQNATGKKIPYDWQVSLDAGIEVTNNHEKSSDIKLTYRTLW